MFDIKFELPHRSYSVSNIQIYFEYIIENHETVTDSRPIKIYVNQKEKGIAFKINRRHYLELLTPEIIKLLGSLKNKITKDGNNQNVPHLQITVVVLAYFNIVNSDYQHDSRILYTFISKKSFGKLLDILTKN